MSTLRRLRMDARLTRKDLSKKSGVGLKTIYNIEAGHNQPTDGTLIKLAAALNVEPNDLDRELREAA